jgi:hypothetical protein
MAVCSINTPAVRVLQIEYHVGRVGDLNNLRTGHVRLYCEVVPRIMDCVELNGEIIRAFRVLVLVEHFIN